MNNVLFVKLDDVLIEYYKKEEESIHWKFKDGILNGIADYYAKGYKLCIVSKKYSVDGGLMLPEDFKTMLYNITNNIAEYLVLCGTKQFDNKGKLFEGSVFSNSYINRTSTINILNDIVYLIIPSQHKDGILVNTNVLFSKYAPTEDSIYVGNLSGITKVNRNTSNIILNIDRNLTTLSVLEEGKAVEYKYKEVKQTSDILGIEEGEDIITINSDDNKLLINYKTKRIYGLIIGNNKEDVIIAESNKVKYIDFDEFVTPKEIKDE